MSGRRNKFNARRTVVDNISFASALEAKRYGELKLLERAGEILNLELQPVYPLVVNGVNCGKLIFDFRYFTRPTNSKRGEYTIEETKGFRTPLYKFKKRVCEALYPGTKIVEVTR